MTEQESEFRRPSMVKIALKYGAFVSLASILFSFFQIQNMIIALIIGISLPVLGIVFAHQEYKNSNNGLMKYGQGLSLGLLVSAVLGVISALITLGFKIIFPESYQERKQAIFDKQVEIWQKQGFSDEQIQQSLEMSEKFESFQMIVTVIGSIILGLILSLIITAFTQKNVKKSL